MKKSGLFLFIVFIFFMACAQKKKQFIPLVGLVQDSYNASSSTSNVSGSSQEEVTLVAGGEKSDISQSPTTSTQDSTSTPVVSVTGSVGTISSSEEQTSPVDNSSSQSSDTTNSNVSTNSNQTSTSETNNSTTTNSTGATEVSSSTQQTQTSTETSSTTNTTPTNSLVSIQPAVTVIMDSSSHSAVLVNGTILDKSENTIGGATITLSGTNANGETLNLYTGTSNAEGLVSGEFTFPNGVSNLVFVLSISGNTSESVTIPVSVTTACKEDNNRGHGNDADGIDEDNTGNSTGVNSNAMDNRKSTDKKKDKCTAGTKYISKIGNITLPVQASQLAFLQEKSNLMAYLNGQNGGNTLVVLMIILFAGLALFLRKKFIVA